MATALSSREEYDGLRASEDRPAPRARLRKLIASDNIAADLPQGTLAEIGQKAMREYAVDVASRKDWMDCMKEAMGLAMQVADTKNYPWPKASNIKFPLVTTAAIQFAARAYPAIINGRDVVKAAVNGNDRGVPQTGPDGQPVTDEQGQPVWQVPPNAKRQRADRIGRHMSWQCLEEMDGWEEETDQLLHILPIVGCAFRKTWFDPVMGKNRSELVTADKLVVNYWAKALETCPRVTQEFCLYPHEIRERERAGLYLEYDYGQPQGSTNDDEAPHDFIEQHCLLDLDEDHFCEPYIVTVHKETQKVCRVIARYDEDAIEVNNDGKVLHISAVEYFTKFDFMPNPEGAFYGIGFGWLLRPLNEAINGAINQMLDAGHLQNTGGGFIGSGLRIKGGRMRFQPGEYKQVNTMGGTIRDNVVPLQFPGPSSTLFNLLGLLIEAARDITSVKDVMTGDEGPANEAAARTLARIEQGMKVFSAIYKRLFRALRGEYRKLFRLNQLYLMPEQYFTLLDEPEAVSQADYQDQDLDVSPAADPNMISDMQRMARAEFLMQFLEDPYIEPLETRRRIFSAANMEEPERLVVQEPPPNPEIAKAADEIELRKKELEQKGATDAEKMAAERERCAEEIASKERIAEADRVAKREDAQLDRENQIIIARMKQEDEARRREEDRQTEQDSRADDREHEMEMRRMDGKMTPELEDGIKAVGQGQSDLLEFMGKMVEAIKDSTERQEKNQKDLMRVLAADNQIVTDGEGRITGSRRVLN